MPAPFRSFTGSNRLSALPRRHPLAICVSALLLSGALAGRAGAQAFPPVIDLGSLTGADGFRLDGAAAGDLSGISVSGAGDVNGDGVDDLIVGAPGADPNGNGDAGSSYVVFGKATPFVTTMALSGLNGSDGFRLDAAVFGFSGRSVSAAGDVNGDGVDDLIVGAFFASPNGNGGAGSSYVVFGKTIPFAAALALSSLNGADGFRLDGATNDFSGRSVSAAGDINGDGLDDLIVGAYRADPNGANSGSSYVVFGKGTPFAATLALSGLNGSDGFRLDGAAAGDFSGVSVSAAGDINGDGLDDLIAGAWGADPNGNSSAGSSYVVFGKTTPFAATLALSSLNGSNGFRLDGVEGDDRSGFSVSAAGDFNGDGLDDLIIGATFASPNGIGFAGSSYVVFGKTTPFAATLSLSDLTGSNGFRLDGVAANDHSGVSVSAAGDINGDGVDDLIIGAYYADPNGNSYAGGSYVVFGKGTPFVATLTLSSLSGSDGFRLDGAAAGDRSGRSVSAAGDINGDGVDDVIVGADSADPNGSSDAGSSYVVFGRAAPVAVPAVAVLGLSPWGLGLLSLLLGWLGWRRQASAEHTG